MYWILTVNTWVNLYYTLRRSPLSLKVFKQNNDNFTRTCLLVSFNNWTHLGILGRVRKLSWNVSISNIFVKLANKYEVTSSSTSSILHKMHFRSCLGICLCHPVSACNEQFVWCNDVVWCLNLAIVFLIFLFSNPDNCNKLWTTQHGYIHVVIYLLYLINSYTMAGMVFHTWTAKHSYNT